MNNEKKRVRYQRIYKQAEELITPVPFAISRMATITALLHYKMDNFFWTGFYILENGELYAGPYQGPVACLHLQKGTGVCWSAVNKNDAEIVPNVHEFPGHIACSEASNSEIVVPVRDKAGTIKAVIDIDSREYNNFNETDAHVLEQLGNLIYQL